MCDYNIFFYIRQKLCNDVRKLRGIRHVLCAETVHSCLIVSKSHLLRLD